jgi:hypothetical protein
MSTIELVGFIIIIVCSFFQLKFLRSTKKALNIFKDIFPENRNLGVDINEVTKQVKGIVTLYKNPVFKTIITSLNEYLENNFDPDTETFREYHRRSLALHENIWKSIDEAAGKSFLNFKDGPITGIYDENEDEIIVY